METNNDNRRYFIIDIVDSSHYLKLIETNRMSQNLTFLRSSVKELIDTVKLPYSVIHSLTPLPMKDKGADGSGQIRFIFEKVQTRPGIHSFYRR